MVGYTLLSAAVLALVATDLFRTGRLRKPVYAMALALFPVCVILGGESLIDAVPRISLAVMVTIVLYAVSRAVSGFGGGVAKAIGLLALYLPFGLFLDALAAWLIGVAALILLFGLMGQEHAKRIARNYAAIGLVIAAAVVGLSTSPALPGLTPSAPAEATQTAAAEATPPAAAPAPLAAQLRRAPQP